MSEPTDSVRASVLRRGPLWSVEISHVRVVYPDMVCNEPGRRGEAGGGADTIVPHLVKSSAIAI